MKTLTYNIDDWTSSFYVFLDTSSTSTKSSSSSGRPVAQSTPKPRRQWFNLHHKRPNLVIGTSCPVIKNYYRDIIIDWKLLQGYMTCLLDCIFQLISYLRYRVSYNDTHIKHDGTECQVFPSVHTLLRS